MHRQAKVPLNHFMATLLVLMTVPCIPCTLLKPPVSNAVGCAKSHLLCTDTDRKATNFICLTSRIAFICWDTTQFVPAHEFHFDCGFCLTVKKYLLKSRIPHKLSDNTGITAADTWLESSSLCPHHVSLSTRSSEWLHCPAQQPWSDATTTAVHADNSILCSPGQLHL